MALVRTATEGDASAIAHVHVESWRTTYTGIVPDSYLAALNEAARGALWRDQLTRGTDVYVAEQDGKIVGFASGGRIREPLQGYDAELFAIYLLQRAQGHGFGSALFRRLAASLAAQGLQSMVAWVLERNPAVAFYTKLGGVPVSATQIEIGGAVLGETAFAWPDLGSIAPPQLSLKKQ